jgi:hypothetical protein
MWRSGLQFETLWLDLLLERHGYRLSYMFVIIGAITSRHFPAQLSSLPPLIKVPPTGVGPVGGFERPNTYTFPGAHLYFTLKSEFFE